MVVGHRRFVDKLKLGGTLFVFTGRLDHRLASKHKALKGSLKKWSKNEQGNLKIQRSMLLSQMEAWTLYLIVEH